MIHDVVVLGLVIAAASGAPVKLAAPGLSATGVTPEIAGFCTEHLAEDLTNLGVRVSTQKEISALLGFERQREMMKCSDTSCMAELANALGVDGLLLGEVAKLGSLYVIDVKVVRAVDGQRMASASAKVHSEEELLDGLDQVSRALAQALVRSRPPEATRAQSASPLAPPAETSPASPSTAAVPPPATVTANGPGLRAPSTLSWILAGGGAVLAAGGGVLGFLAMDRHNQLTSPSGATVDAATGDRLAREEATFQRWGLITAGAGVAAIAAGATVYAIRGPSAPAVAVSVFAGPSGPVAFVGGTFP